MEGDQRPFSTHKKWKLGLWRVCGPSNMAFRIVQETCALLAPWEPVLQTGGDGICRLGGVFVWLSGGIFTSGETGSAPGVLGKKYDWWQGTGWRFMMMSELDDRQVHSRVRWDVQLSCTWASIVWTREPHVGNAGSIYLQHEVTLYSWDSNITVKQE